MTEREYIDATDCRSLGHVLDSLGQICPANSEVIDDAEFKAIVATIYRWRTKLFEKFEVKEE